MLRLVMVSLLVVAACLGHPEHRAPNNRVTVYALVTARSSTDWEVRVARTQASRTATTTIIVTTAPTATAPAPHSMVAAADAWLTIASEAFAANADADAIAAARVGIKELGRDYCPKLIKDDTELKIGMSDDSIRAGDDHEGAKALISVLRQRVELYFEKYAGVIRRP